MHKINLAQKLSLIKDHWNRGLRASLTASSSSSLNSRVRLPGIIMKMKMKCSWSSKAGFAWTIAKPAVCAKNGLEAGEFIIVPRGVEHRPFAEAEAEVLLFEPAATLNTGNVQDEFTRKELATI